MPRIFKVALVILVIICVATVLSQRISSGAREPKLEVVFHSITNDSGRLVATFGVTNVGDAVAVGGSSGIVEYSHQGQWMVGCQKELHSLGPAEGELVDVWLPLSTTQNWRFITLYSHGGLKGRLYDWQWSPGGPGPRLSKYEPLFLKSVRLNVNSTSSWISGTFPGSAAPVMTQTATGN